MSMTQIDVNHAPIVACANQEPHALHRIETVRRQQGVSVRRAAQHLHCDSRQVRYEETPTTDLPLSRLYEWQEALDVPVADLLVDSNGPLSAPVMGRAKMIRVMKTVAAIVEKAPDVATRRLGQNLMEQLTEIMPELAGVSPWHSVGQRRGPHEYGRIVERLYADAYWREHD